MANFYHKILNVLIIISVAPFLLILTIRLPQVLHSTRGLIGVRATFRITIIYIRLLRITLFGVDFRLIQQLNNFFNCRCNAAALTTQNMEGFRSILMYLRQLQRLYSLPSLYFRSAQTALVVLVQDVVTREEANLWCKRKNGFYDVRDKMMMRS